VLERARIFSDSSAADADELLAGWFDALAPGPGTTGLTIEVNGRDIPTVRRADGVAWFDFQALCGGQRSQDDYIEIARAFGAVILAKVPVLDEFHENEARRFIALVDEFYDRRVKLVMSAAQPVDRLYLGRRLVREFERTRSRLLEMQSHRYLAAAHLP
jgi:cell division protein ZapE